MCINLFFSRNFRRTIPISPSTKSYQSFSDNLYDKSKGIALYYLNIGTDEHPVYRTVYDAELAYSNSPAIRSIVSKQMQASLRQGLMSQPKSNVSTVIPVKSSYELSERVELGKSLLAKAQLDSMSRDVSTPLADSASSTEPVSSIDPAPLAE